MNRILLATAILSLGWPVCAWSCDGIAGRDVAVTSDGQKFTVTNTGRGWVRVNFAASGADYNLQLAPGQSDTPRSTGMFPLPMRGYQSCVATPLPVASSGALPSSR